MNLIALPSLVVLMLYVDKLKPQQFSAAFANVATSVYVVEAEPPYPPRRRMWLKSTFPHTGHTHSYVRLGKPNPPTQPTSPVLANLGACES